MYMAAPVYRGVGLCALLRTSERIHCSFVVWSRNNKQSDGNTSYKVRTISSSTKKDTHTNSEQTRQIFFEFLYNFYTQIPYNFLCNCRRNFPNSFMWYFAQRFLNGGMWHTKHLCWIPLEPYPVYRNRPSKKPNPKIRKQNYILLEVPWHLVWPSWRTRAAIRSWLYISRSMALVKLYKVCWECNLGHILTPSLHLAGLENVWFVGSNFETVGARRGHTNKLYYFICLDTKSI